MKNKESTKNTIPQSIHTAWDSLIEIPYKAQFDERVEKQKTQIQATSFLSHDDEIKNKVEETPTPTTSEIVKLGRMLIRVQTMSKLFPHVFRKSNRRQELEAMHVAYSEELERRRILQRELEVFQEEQEKRQLIEVEEERERERERKIKEQSAFERDFFDGVERVHQETSNIFRKERLQEMAERDFNDKLTSIEEIQVAAEVGDCGVEKIILKNKGDTITRHDELGREKDDAPAPNEVVQYNLNGYPFACLFHTTTWGGNKPVTPDTWALNKASSHAPEGLSVSYINTEAPNTKGMRSSSEISSLYLYYGFLTIEPSSIITVRLGHGGTSGMSTDRPRMGAESTNYISYLESDEEDRINEIYLRRFNEKGQPKKPDCIITYNNYISNYALEHAAVFNIPIININESFYPKK